MLNTEVSSTSVFDILHSTFDILRDRFAGFYLSYLFQFFLKLQYMPHKKIIIAGGTGFIGQAMARYFGKENHVVILGRKAVNGHHNRYNHHLVRSTDGYNITYCRWDGRHIEKHWAREIDGADLVINLAGKSVNCRYHEKNKQEIVDSRTHSTKVLAEAIRRATVPPKLWINAASATIYRHATDHPQHEQNGIISEWKNDNMPYSYFDRLRWRWKKAVIRARYGASSERYNDLDKDFSVAVCRLWENAFFEERTPFTRKIALRAAITLGEGGVMIPYFNLLKFGLGGYHGNGTQMYSWIHVEDLCRIVEWSYENKEMEGVYNCAAPNAVTNADFMKTLRSITGHKIGLPAFTWMLEAGAALIGTETELILKSRWVHPARLLQTGFQFKYNHLREALAEIVQRTPRKKYHLF
jgi:NAD dependent epimerase/dehydratase family enzyme